MTTQFRRMVGECRRTCQFLILVIGLLTHPCHASKRRFTVADDLALSHFGDPYGSEVAPVALSPNGRYFVVDTERGRMDQNCPESTLWVFRMKDIEQFLSRSGDTHPPSAVWKFNKSTYRNGPII